MSRDVGLWLEDGEWAALVDKSESISRASKVSYKKQLRSTIRTFRVQGPHALSTILSDPDGVKTAMEAIPDNSLRTYLGALVSLFKRGEEGGHFRRSDSEIARLHGIWSELLQRSSRRYGARIDDNTESERERESRTSVGDWLAAYKRMLAVSPLSPSTLLLAFHALMTPPLRGGDLSRVHIGFTDSGNCIFRNQAEPSQSILFIRDHKTSRSHGTLVRHLSGELVDVLRASVAETPRDWLFQTQSGSPYSESGFSSWKSSVFHEAFGRNVTTNSLRHAYISSLDRQNQSISEARGIAKDMGHGLHTQRQYVRLNRG